MFRKYFALPAALAIGSLFVAAGAVQAQHRGGGAAHVGSAHVGSARVVRSANVGHVGAVHVGANYGRAYYGAHPYHYGYGDHYGYGYGYGGLYGGAYWPLFQPYGYGAYPYVNPYASYDYDYAPVAPYYTPSVSNYAGSVASNGTAAVEVILPDPQARVWFDGTLTLQTGTDRMFQTAVLSSAGTYRIRAAWYAGGQQVSQERTVTVAPNQTAVVDFTRPPGG